MLGSAALQMTASLQRWVWFRDDRSPRDPSAEDHLYDYAYPADPWVPIGNAAELYGLGYLLLALAVLAAAAAVAVHTGIVAGLLAAIVAGSFALDGVHAVLSGVSGVPSPVQDWISLQWSISAIGCLCLIGLAILWARVSRAAAVSSLLLLGNTVPGYLIATFATAPAIAGYQSHDTTPWTETVVAISAAAAGITMLAAAWSAGPRRT